MSPMQISSDGEAFIKQWELCRLKAFLPTHDDVPTIGWGTTGPDIHLRMTWTQEQADTRFDQDIRRFSQSVWLMVSDGAPTSQAQFDALASLAYNEGAHAIATSHLMMYHHRGDYRAAANEFGNWIYQKGHVVNGLVRRRAAEKVLYLSSGASPSAPS